MEKTQPINTHPNGWLHGRLGTVVLWALLITLESSGQIATKLGGDQLGAMAFSLHWLQAVMTDTGDRSRLMLDVDGHRATRKAELVEIAAEAIERVKAEVKKLTDAFPVYAA